MRKNRPTRRSRSNPFSRLMGGERSSALRKAPRRRDVERLEPRQVLSATVQSNPYFEDQWNLDERGQQTEFDPFSPTFDQTIAEIDINVSDVWDQVITGAGVQVGIISGGFDLNHEDLVGAFIENLALDALGGAGVGFTDPTDVNGTAVAGIIGARNNDLGVVGIAYEADLIPIRAVDGQITDPAAETPLNAATALRWRLGLVQDADGDGIVDNGTTGFTASEVIDVYYVNGEVSGIQDDTQGGGPDRLAPEVLEAIQTGANGGRGSWTDLDGDGIFDLDEAKALGAIYVVPAGDDNGTAFSFPFTDTGFSESSQYNELASSRYTIAVGAVDYDGRYENNSSGTVTSFAEMGANVLLVAPSGTNQIDLAGQTSLNSGILTTDLTGEDGNNRLPLPLFGEVDGDFFPDTNYTSTFGGTEAAAAQVTGVVAQMLEVNPDLSRRDVEQILLMSAQTADQFDESWIVNPYSYWQSGFDEAYNAPVYHYTDIDVGPMFDGEPDIEDAVLPNNPFVNFDGGFLNTNTYDANVYRSYVNFPNAEALGGLGTTVDPALLPDITIDTFSFGLVDNAVGVRSLVSSLQQQNEITTPLVPTIHAEINDLNEAFRRMGVRDLISPASLEEVPLQFENGVGYTVSHGRGRYLEEYGYAHGLLDAALAVDLARAWLPESTIAGDQGITKAREVSISSPILDGDGGVINIQGRADVATGRGTENFIIPGGRNGTAINTGFYEEYTNPVTGTAINVNGVEIGEVITGGPFYAPNGQSFTFSDGNNELRIPIDQSVDFDFLSLESIELRAGLVSGDIDHLRISILAPDGTQTELNPYNLPNGVQGPIVAQSPQFGQSSPVPNLRATIVPEDDQLFIEGDIIDRKVGDGDPAEALSLGFVGGNGGDNGFDNANLIDVNVGSDIKLFGNIDTADRLVAGDAWTWSTNRHYGELLSVEAASFTPSLQDNVSLDDGWELIFENWGGPVDLTGVQVTFHGTEATGQRIQGKVGIDDNAQNIDLYNLPTAPGGPTATNPTPEQLGDGVFNFNRFIEFGEVVADPTPTYAPNVNSGGAILPGVNPALQSEDFLLLDGDEVVYTVVLDDPNDSVDLSNLPGNAYRTIDPDTGIERSFAVVDKFDYLNDVHDNASRTLAQNNLQQSLIAFDPSFSSTGVVTASMRKTNGVIGFVQEAPRQEEVNAIATVRVDGTPGAVRNFDYSQESFASRQTVTATQFRVNYDNAGNPTQRIATGEVQRFVTGADGNYYFDVASNPAPPDPVADPDEYANWFEDFGFTLEYDIALLGQEDRLFDQSYAPDAQDDPLSQVSFVEQGKYTVQLFDATDVLNGQTTKVKDVNFLLAIDPAEVQLNVTGTVVRDINGNQVNEVATGPDGTYEGIIAYYDANDNNQRDLDEVFSTSDADGLYELSFDPAEDEEVSIRLDPNSFPVNDPLRPLGPLVAGEPEFTLTNFDPGDVFVQDFFLKPTASVVTGTVWQDTDADGDFDPTEIAFDGTQLGVDGVNPALFVYHDSNNNAVFDPGETVAPVSATGVYQLEFNDPGSYVIRLDVTNADFSQTFPTGAGANLVTVLPEEVITDTNFGVKSDLVFDYGDLPDTYGTTLGSSSEGGARHRVTNETFFLGSGVPDLEVDGRPTFNADGDDNNGRDDEDGVTLMSDSIVAGGTIDFEIVANGGTMKLNAWIDWNDDGVFTSDELVFDDLGSLGTGVATTITGDVPDVIAVRDRYAARFRWGTSGLGPTGPSNGGEVEDYWLIPQGATITGQVLRDLDNDAVFEPGFDTPISGVRVFIDENLDGVRQANEPSAVTDDNGMYSFEVVVVATDTPINIRAEESTLPAGTTFLEPIDGLIAELADPGETIVENFLLAPENREDQTISGQVFQDRDANPGIDGTEEGFEDVQVQLLTLVDGSLSVIATTRTSATGGYTFDVENTGDYEVRIVLPTSPTLVLTTPSSLEPGPVGIPVTVGIDDDIAGVNFAIFDRRTTFTRDYGDLRVGGGDNYPTLDSENGPSHFVDGVTFLGSTVDADEGTLSSGNATADDLDSGAGVDDEDGVTLLTPQITADGPIAFNVNATGPAGSVLNAWVDFDDDGTFQADEQIVTNLPLESGKTTRIDRIANPDTNLASGFLNTRFRWGTPDVGPTGSTNASGVDAVGEVEDHRVPVVLNASVLVGDYDNSGEVTEADYDFWRSTFGATVPIGTGADGNSDGRVDIADYTVWREIWDLTRATGTSSAAAAPASSPAASAASSAVSVVETSEPSSLIAAAGIPVGAASQAEASALDESLAIDDADEGLSDNALEAALLEWSFEDGAAEHREEVEALGEDEEESEDQADTLESAFDSVFAL